jgi:hypothetical protein
MFIRKYLIFLLLGVQLLLPSVSLAQEQMIEGFPVTHTDIGVRDGYLWSSYTFDIPIGGANPYISVFVTKIQGDGVKIDIIDACKEVGYSNLETAVNSASEAYNSKVQKYQNAKSLVQDKQFKDYTKEERERLVNSEEELSKERRKNVLKTNQLLEKFNKGCSEALRHRDTTNVMKAIYPFILALFGVLMTVDLVKIIWCYSNSTAEGLPKLITGFFIKLVLIGVILWMFSPASVQDDAWPDRLRAQEVFDKSSVFKRWEAPKPFESSGDPNARAFEKPSGPSSNGGGSSGGSSSNPNTSEPSKKPDEPKKEEPKAAPEPEKNIFQQGWDGITKFFKWW